MSEKSNNIVLLSTFDNDVGKRSLYDSSNNQKITEEIFFGYDENVCHQF